MPVSEDAVRDALRHVEDPELHKDIVSLGMVKGIEFGAGRLFLSIELTTPACPLKDQIEGDVRTALAPLGITDLEIQWSAQVGSSRGPDAERVPGVRNILAVASGKGGVGKSTVAVNLAAALVADGARVGLMDLDLYGPSAPLMTGTSGRKPEIREGRIVPVDVHGMRVLSIGYLVPEGRAVVWRGPLLHKAITQFFEDVDWGELDYLVLDMPPGTGDVQISLTQLVPLTGAVMVTTPQPVALTDVLKGANMFDSVNVPLLGIVENMSYFVCPCCGERAEIFSHGGGRKMADEHGWPFLGEIPIDPSVRVGGDEGTPVVISHPDSAVATAFRTVARTLAGKVSQMGRLGKVEV